MNRREFIVGSASLMLSTAVLAKSEKQKNIDIYIDESGNVGNGNPFIIGALVVESDYDHERILNIRKESGFRQVLEYSNSNRYKKLFSSPLFEEFFNSKKLSFSAIAFPANINETWPSRRKHRSVIYHHNYADFINKNTLSESKLKIHIERRTTTGEEYYLKSFLEKYVRHVEISFINSNKSDFMQLSDLITGSVFGEMTSVKDKTKVGIINDLKSAMNITQLSKNIDYKKGKFKLDVRTRL